MDLRTLEGICGAFRNRLKALQVQAGLARVVILGLLLLPAFLFVDWWIHLSTAWRLIGLLAYAAALGCTLWFTLLKPLAHRWSNKEVLRFIDNVQPQGMLLDLYELLEGKDIQELSSDTGKKLASAAVTDLEPLVRQADLSVALRAGKVRRWLAGGLMLALLFGAACATMGNYISIGCQRFFNPFSSAYWPHRTNIEVVEPKNGWSIPQIESFTLEANVSGVVPPQITLAYRSETTGYWIKEKVDVRNGAIAYEFKEVREPLKFYLSGGDFETAVQPVSVVERPYLKGIVARYEYPKYAGIPNKEEPNGQLRGLEGTKVRLSFKTSIPIQRALFLLDQEALEELKLSSDTTVEKELMLAKNGRYVIQLVDKNGFREPASKPERYEIQVTPDEPPIVELLSPASDLSVTKNVMVDVAFKAKDDFGLKKVDIQYQIDDGPLTPLSDRITGPIAQTGLQGKAEFHWDLRRMENLPEQGTLTCVVTAQDVNPTGRGVDKKQFQISLVKISEFHRKAVADAQEMMREALNAYNRQWDAWEKGQQLTSGGTGKLDDPAWLEMNEAQSGAEQSAKRMASLHAELTAACEANHLEREFMARRLKQIGEQLQKITGPADAELPKIADGLKRSRPAGSSDEVPERLKTLRAGVVNKIKDSQKLAVLYLERIIGNAYDWRDLQSATIATMLLWEDQGDLRTGIEKIAPRFAGKEKQDLSDADQTELEKIGTRQRGLFDSETKLESMLSEMIYAAKKQQRRNILPHLEAPFTLLRSNRTRDMLDRAAKSIADNRPFAIKNDLAQALDILGAVKTGLLIAGEKVDNEEQIALNTPLTSKKDFEAVKEVAESKKSEPGDTQETTIVAVDPKDLLKILPPGQDKLSLLIAQANEMARTAASRTTYLLQPRQPAEMPRCMRLNFARAREMQGGVSEGLRQAAAEAANPAIPPFLKEQLSAAQESVTQMDSLLAAKDVSALTQQLQEDFTRGLDDLIQFIAFQKKVDEATAENKRGHGVDEHQQKFLLRDKDLEAAEGAVRDLNGISVLEKDVCRSVTRFSKTPAQGPLQLGIEKTNRDRAVNGQKKLASHMETAVAGKVAALSAEVAPRVKEEGMGALLALRLGPLSAEIAGGNKDKELSPVLSQTVTTMDLSLQSLLALLEERVKIQVADAPKTEEKAISQAEFEKQNSAESLTERIKADTSLPPNIKEKMLESLSRGFPAKYKEFLTAYYSSCLQTEKKP